MFVPFVPATEISHSKHFSVPRSRQDRRLWQEMPGRASGGPGGDRTVQIRHETLGQMRAIQATGLAMSIWCRWEVVEIKGRLLSCLVKIGNIRKVCGGELAEAQLRQGPRLAVVVHLVVLILLTLVTTARPLRRSAAHLCFLGGPHRFTRRHDAGLPLSSGAGLVGLRRL